ncbi:CsiV family protein [Pseudoalteromonas sp. T1lg65]|uniref:CsiV family protein n=1 Tax=Pseudoalteromonas sp. T1lg65 TaxID=2077101 RepID=UPI003F79CC4C
MKNIIKTVLLLSSLSTSNAHAVRWFEVELIAFEQQESAELKEDFSIELEPLSRRNTLDLLTAGYNNTGFNSCMRGDRAFANLDLIHNITMQTSSWACDPNFSYIDLYDRLPITPEVQPQDHMDSIYLLAPDQLQFTDKIAQLKRKGLQPLLHTGWRFPETSKRRAPNVIIKAGERQPIETSYVAIPSINDLLAGTQQFDLSEEQSTISYQLEGFIKIHVRHYLYVTTDLDLKYEDNGKLNTARMSQYTRVYSGDVHYLDHPKLGVIFQIRKYKH